MARGVVAAEFYWLRLRDQQGSGPLELWTGGLPSDAYPGHARRSRWPGLRDHGRPDGGRSATRACSSFTGQPRDAVCIEVEGGISAILSPLPSSRSASTHQAEDGSRRWRRCWEFFAQGVLPVLGFPCSAHFPTSLAGGVVLCALEVPLPTGEWFTRRAFSPETQHLYAPLGLVGYHGRRDGGYDSGAGWAAGCGGLLWGLWVAPAQLGGRGTCSGWRPEWCSSLPIVQEAPIRPPTEPRTRLE